MHSIGTDGFSIFDAERELGLLQLGVRVDVGGVFYPVVFKDITETSAAGIFYHGLLRCQIRLIKVPGRRAYQIEYTIENPSSQTVQLGEVETGQFGDGDGVKVGRVSDWDIRFCHTDNLRIERYPHCQMDLPYLKIPPVDPIHLGRGEDQPFPGIYLTNREYGNGMVLASVSQDLNFQSYRLQRLGASSDLTSFGDFSICHEFPLCNGYVLEPGSRCDLDGIYVELLQDTHPEDAFEGYLAFLAERNDFRGTQTPLRSEAFYCSWNYGRMADQTAANQLPTAEFIAQEIPNIRTYLLDDGYTRGSIREDGSREPFNFHDAFYPDPENCVNRERFPKGVDGFFEDLRRLGLKPGIWWSPQCVINSRLHREHPDWFLRNTDGETLILQGYGGTGHLDLTVPGAYAYTEKVISTIFEKWGATALKMDFWSHAFEMRHLRYSKPNVTGPMARKLLFDLVRKYMPEDGIFMTCCATGMGNPFLATHADAFRNTIDIGRGSWREQIHTSFWTLPALGRAGRQSYLHNNDSVGVNADCGEDENFFRLNWCFITQGTQEIGGFLEKLPVTFKDAFRKYTDHCDRGHRCFCPDEKAWRGEPLPEVLYVDYPTGSPSAERGVSKHIALFNWSEAPRVVGAVYAALGIGEETPLHDFWTGERIQTNEHGLFVELRPRQSLLVQVGR
ncbi:alpha-galactosidase [Puniceicoccus vermicola]|uniref:Alpha-galactosidase n=1 Tax=Puniceicoccus vermicola TaxID=388746 RepID=A0A7X1B2F6_9BACT|nr:alpha-galactosidase [Puniceicoccus vermicola]MBC2603180.1 alpha-galactosidase [Puniceicoccus vermicola]